MTWHRRLLETLYLKDARKVATLAEARDVLLSLPACRKAALFWLGAAPDIESPLSRAFVAGELI